MLPRNKSSKTLWLRLFTITAALTLSSCGTVQINDSMWCGDLGSDGASCFHTLSNGSRDLTYSQWAIEREGQVCTTAATFADLKGVIEKLCSKSGSCTYEQKKTVQTFMNNVQRVSHP